jgi:hypothetical protein
MKHKIFVHIGLPKTATTSLQTDLFPRLAGNDIEYLGVFQPRDESVQGKLYRSFTKSFTNRVETGALRESLARKLQKKNLILSEEMISVSQWKHSWKEKLAYLKTVLEGFDHEIVVTVREPVAALFSYYCEIYPLLGPERRSFIDVALQSEPMQIFHYDKLISELSRHFATERLHFFKFEDLIANDTSALEKLVTGTGMALPSEPLRNLNHRSERKGRVITRHFFTAADLLREISPGLGAAGEKPSSKTLARLLKWSQRLRLGLIKITPPNDEEILHLRENLSQENEVLDRHFGIKY